MASLLFDIRPRLDERSWSKRMIGFDLVVRLGRYEFRTTAFGPSLSVQIWSKRYTSPNLFAGFTLRRNPTMGPNVPRTRLWLWWGGERRLGLWRISDV